MCTPVKRLFDLQVWDPVMATEVRLREVTDDMLDDKEEFGPLIFLRCGHICFMVGLDGWMELQSCYRRSETNVWIELEQLQWVRESQLDQIRGSAVLLYSLASD